MTRHAKPKKPLSKATSALNEQLRRKHGTRDLAKRFLIVCEDSKSAPNYFKALKKHFNLTAASIQVADSGAHTQPNQVVGRAIEMKNAASDDDGTEPFDHVWCVIDGDFGKEKISRARLIAKANDIKLAISTQCFEFWVLLHFEECDTSHLKCDAVVRELRKRHLPKYAKGTCDFGEIVKSVPMACERAKRLRKPGLVRGDLPEVHNPCSEVYILVEAILASP